MFAHMEYKIKVLALTLPVRMFPYWLKLLPGSQCRDFFRDWPCRFSSEVIAAFKGVRMEHQAVTLDIHEALQRFSGNRQIFVRLLHRFLELNSGIEDKAKRVLENRNLEEAAIFFHSIKGGAGNLSAKDLYHKASLLEDLSRSGDFEAVNTELPAFFDLFAQLKAAVDDVQNG